MTHILGYTRLSPLFDEMFLAADSDERKLYRRLLDTRLFYFFTYRLLFGIHVATYTKPLAKSQVRGIIYEISEEMFYPNL